MNNTNQENAVKIDFLSTVLELFKLLTPREKDVLQRRFKLNKEQDNQRETLEKIGRSYDITRERVRQIEIDSVRKLKAHDKHEAYFPIKEVEKVIHNFLKKHGGAIEEEHLFEELLCFFHGAELNFDDAVVKANKEALSFVLSQLLADQFEKVPSKGKYKMVWKLKTTPWNFIEEVLDKLVEIINKGQKPIHKDNLVDKFKKSKFYHQAVNKFQSAVSDFKEEVMTFDETLHSYLKMRKDIKKSSLFEEWGLAHWNTITPKRMNDKIYLVLKKAAAPLHFGEIAEAINKVKFDNKKACAATVHNELILDPKYVLVGRGIYALREWGYKSGTVAEIVAEILKEKGPLTKDEILEELKKQRIVKRATVQLALMNKDRFQKMADGHYKLIEAEAVAEAA